MIADSASRRDLYATEAARSIPQLLQLLDRDPWSPTFGCFDREYWHYRTLDFPCGMSQEFVYPLALVYALPFPGNRWHGQPRLKEWVEAGIRWARLSAHRDGSCDDYYPFERALGAATFSLAAMAEACHLLAIRDDKTLEFLSHRARWVASHGESGVLTNHHAIAAAALDSTGRLTGDASLRLAARHKAEEVLSHQHAEGWFREYEGFDPGYQTVTVDFLARYWQSSGDERVLPALEKAVQLLEIVQHPDGGFGGEYASRNTFHTQPHGLELLAPALPAARRVADRFLAALAQGRRAINDDHRLGAHHLYPYILAWRDFAPRSALPTEPPAPGRHWFPEAGFFVDRTPAHFMIAGMKKGGPFRCFRGSELLASDSGLVLETEAGEVLVSHLGHDAKVIRESPDRVSCEGELRPSRRERMTPVKMVVLRLLMLTIGRFARDFVRKRLQKRLILARGASPFRFRRTITADSEGYSIEDVLTPSPGAPKITRAAFAVGKTSIYIAASHPWHDSYLQAEVPIALPSSGGPITVRRRLP